MKKLKKAYIPPQLDAVTVEAERGFAYSIPMVNELNVWVTEDGIVTADEQSHIEVYQTGNNWTQGSNHFWD